MTWAAQWGELLALALGFLIEEFRPVLGDPGVDFLAVPDVASGQVLDRLGEVRPFRDRAQAGLADAEPDSYLGGAHQLVGVDPAHCVTVRVGRRA
jgi:hypothetical protein